MIGFLALSQSLLHQVTYSDPCRSAGEGRCPRARVSIPFTSGHVFRLRAKPKKRGGYYVVSIPFTSGHVFRRPGSRCRPRRSGMSQSLLHQVTYSDNSTSMSSGSNWLGSSQSLLHQVTYSDSFANLKERRDNMVSQSLLHQVTYSDTPSKREDRLIKSRCLNPFYIRSRIPTLPQSEKID